MVLHPRMIVSNPPITIVPRVMVVVVAIDHYRRWWRVDVWRRRLISIRRWLIPMSAVKTGLERHRSKHQYQGFQTRKFAHQKSTLRPKGEASRMPTMQAGNHTVSCAVRTAVTRIRRPLLLKIYASKITSRERVATAWGAVLQPGQVFVVWAVTGMKLKRTRPRTYGGLNDAR
jgi:hypothetical protein